MLSIIVPAHNEAQLLADTLRALNDAAQRAAIDFELIVVDDDSTDETATIAQRFGAVVIAVAHHHIAATRNAGARAARFPWLLFVDADTHVPTETFNGAITSFRTGAVGGTAIVMMDEPRTGLWIRVSHWVSKRIIRNFKITPGCFVFATRAAHDAIGGFDESYFAAEDVAYGKALRKLGRFDVINEVVWTSARKMRWYSPRDYFRLAWAWVRHGNAVLKSREHLGIWYGGRRSK